jgi:PKD repeat protein
MGKLIHQRGGLHAACILTACAAAMLLYACAGGAGPAGFHRAPQPSIASALVELDEMFAPAGVDSALWAELKGALAKALRERSSDLQVTTPLISRPGGRESSHIVSTPPTGASNAVNDLAIINDAGSPRLTWHYHNLGDYDQSGTVNIADITPLAVHFGETHNVVTEQNSLTAVIDGSGNGKVDIADVTAIAVGFGVNCAAYKIQNAATALSSSWSDLLEVPQENGTGDGRLEYAITVGMGSGEYYRVVPVDGDGVEGEPSNVQRFMSEPPEVVGISPTGGVTGTQVPFTATVTGSEPISVQWDFGDGATPRLPYGKQVTVTLGDVGEYPCSVTANNALDSDTLEFTLTVELVPPDPPDIQSVTPTNGVTGAVVQFTAEVTGDEPFTYYWDFGGGATPNTISEEQPTVTLGAPGTYDTANLQVVGPGGEDTHDFDLTVLPVSTGFKVIAAGVAANHPSMVVADGNPAIAFTKPGDGSDAVCYVRAKDNAGLQWEDYRALPGSNGFYSNNMMRIIAGNPAVASSVGSMIPEYGRIDFARAQDPVGDAWNSVVLVYDGFQTHATAPGLMEVAGRPALAFSNDYSENCKLLYVRAEDAAGKDWPTDFSEVAEGLSSSSYAQTSMVFAEGNPAILHTWWDGAIYVRSSDIYGNEWGTPFDIAYMSSRSSMTLIGHNPAVAIETGGELPHALIYRLALDPAGAEWGDVVTVVSDEGEGVVGSGGRICLAEINGRPAIAYSHTPGTFHFFVKYVVAKDNEGSEWNDPVTVDPATDVSDGIALAEVAGGPAMAYGNRVGEELIYIHAVDNFGLEWPE